MLPLIRGFITITLQNPYPTQRLPTSTVVSLSNHLVWELYIVALQGSSVSP